MINFDLNSFYLSNLYPKRNEEVEVSILIKNTFCFDRAFLTYFNEGGINKRELRRFNYNSSYDRYSASFNTSWDDETYLSFEFEKDNKVFYYSKAGLKPYPSIQKNMYKILNDLNVPCWINGRSAYQILVDRFFNKRGDIGVRNNEYNFDGASSRELKEDEIPPSFSQSRCLDFYNGDLYGVIDKIPYLKELGISCIYFNPIFSARTMHRYDCIDFFNVDEHIGGNEAFIQMVKALHENDIKVIIDISINHVGSDHPWFLSAQRGGDEREFFYQREDGSFIYWYNVQTLPQLNYNSEKLKDIIYRSEDSVLKRYLKEPFNIDGWRLDVANVLGRFEDNQMTKELWSDINSHLRMIKKDVYLVGEHWLDPSDYIDGKMWDASMNYLGSGRLLRLYKGEKDRFSLDSWGHDIKDTKPLSLKELSNAIKETQDAILEQYRDFQYNLFDSHDTPRIYNYNKGMSKYENILMILYSLAGLPSLYYGDENKLNGRLSDVEGSRYLMDFKKDEKLFSLLSFLAKIRKSKAFSTGFKVLDIKSNVLGILRYSKKESYLFLIVDRKSKVKLDLSFLNYKEIKLIYGKTKIEDSTFLVESSSIFLIS